MIELKLKIDKLVLISRVFGIHIKLKLPLNNQEKADLNLAKKMFGKFAKKIGGRINKPKEKEFKMSFEYYEAFLMEKVISANLWHFMEEDYEFSTLNSIDFYLQENLEQNV